MAGSSSPATGLLLRNLNSSTIVWVYGDSSSEFRVAIMWAYRVQGLRVAKIWEYRV